MSEELEEIKISKFIVEKILKQPNMLLRSDRPLISSGIIDSFSLVDLALYIEDEFGVYIDDTELNKETFDTIDQLIHLIRLRRS